MLDTTDPSTQTACPDTVSQFLPKTVNGVGGLYFRVMTPDETGADSIGNPNTVTDSLSQLPPSILTNLRDKGVHWVIVPDSADQAMPDANLTSQTPTGWPPYRDPNNPDSKLDWGDVSSMAVSPTSPLPLPNTVIVGTNNPDGDYSQNVTLHETGHAYNYNNGMPSRSKAFGAAYEADVPNMTTPSEATKENPSDGYYLQQPTDPNTDRARAEAYAEGFARYYGNDKSSLQKDWPAMYRYWNDFDSKQRSHPPRSR